MKKQFQTNDRADALKTRRFGLRLSEQEEQQFLELEKALGLSRADIFRIRVLKDSAKMLVNSKELLQQLDAVGSELGRSGNNINQLAKHANILHKQGLLNVTIVTEFSCLLGRHIDVQRDLEKNIRQIIRLMRGL